MNQSFSSLEDATGSAVRKLDIRRALSLFSWSGPAGFATHTRFVNSINDLIELKKGDYEGLIDYFRQRFPQDVPGLESAIQANLSQLELMKPQEAEFLLTVDDYMTSFKQLEDIISEKHIRTETKEIERPSSLLTLKEAAAKMFLGRKYTYKSKKYTAPDYNDMIQDGETASKIRGLGGFFEKCLEKAAPLCEQFNILLCFDKKSDEIYDARMKEDDFLKYMRPKFTGMPIVRSFEQAEYISDHADFFRMFYSIYKTGTAEPKQK